MSITLVTGGARSGKSTHAEQLALSRSDNPLYLATAKVWDDEFATRIKRHQDGRDSRWTTVEVLIDISKVEANNRVILLDCITLWLNNIFYQEEYNLDSSVEIAKAEWDRFIAKNSDVVIVTNEIGMGVVSEHKNARRFCDLQGWINQHIARSADEVIFMVSGIATKIK